MITDQPTYLPTGQAHEMLPHLTNQKGDSKAQFCSLYVNLPVTQPPVDRLTPEFACREQMGFTFQRIFFGVNSFW